jgi:hypothetical protein
MTTTVMVGMPKAMRMTAAAAAAMATMVATATMAVMATAAAMVAVAAMVCENISTGISLCCDSAFAHKKECSIFKFPERFLEISWRDLTISTILNSNHLKNLFIRILWTLVMSLSDAQAMICTVILTDC